MSVLTDLQRTMLINQIGANKAIDVAAPVQDPVMTPTIKKRIADATAKKNKTALAAAQGPAFPPMDDSVGQKPSQKPQNASQAILPKDRMGGVKKGIKSLRNESREHQQGALGEINAAMDEALAATEAVAKAESELADIQARSWLDKEMSIERHQADMVALRQERETKRAEVDKKIEKLRKYGRYYIHPSEVDRLEDIITNSDDPNKKKSAQALLEGGKSIKDRRPLSSKILSIIGAMIGAFGEAYGGKNYGMEMMEMAIDEDIARQQSMRESANLELKDAQDSLAIGEMLFDEREEQLAAAKMVEFERIDAELSKIESEHKGSNYGTKAAEMKAAIREKYRVEKLKVYDSYMNKDIALTDLQLKSEMFTAQQQDRYLAQLMASENAGKGKGMSESTALKLANSDIAIKLSEDLLKYFKKYTGKASMLMKNIPLTDDIKYKKMIDVWAQAVGKNMEGGKLTDYDYKKYQNFAPQPEDSYGMALSKINYMISYMSNRYNSHVKALGKAGYDVSNFNPKVFVEQSEEEPGKAN